MNSLPIEIKMLIFNKLRDSSLLSAMLVCKEWKSIVDDACCWKQRCQNDYYCSTFCSCAYRCKVHFPCKSFLGWSKDNWKAHFMCMCLLMREISPLSDPSDMIDAFTQLLLSDHRELLLRPDVYRVPRTRFYQNFYYRLAESGDLDMNLYFLDLSDRMIFGQANFVLKTLYIAAGNNSDVRVASLYKSLYDTFKSVPVIFAQIEWEDARDKIDAVLAGIHADADFGRKRGPIYRDFAYYVCFSNRADVLELLLQNGLSPDYHGFEDMRRKTSLLSFCLDPVSEHGACAELLMRYKSTEPASKRRKTHS